jgi:hypothetical protein
MERYWFTMACLVIDAAVCGLYSDNAVTRLDNAVTASPNPSAGDARFYTRWRDGLTSAAGKFGRHHTIGNRLRRERYPAVAMNVGIPSKYQVVAARSIPQCPHKQFDPPSSRAPVCGSCGRARATAQSARSKQKHTAAERDLP